jgi:sugar/nucleoside kinase (ribokinase family)
VTPRVFVLGDLMCDIVAVQAGPLAAGSDTPASIAMRPGGSGANVAAWLAFAGVGVALIGRTGDDAAADIALRGLDGVDLRVTRDPACATGTCVVLVAPGGERTMLPDPGANDTLTTADLPDDLDGAEILHVAGYMLLRPGSRAAALEAMDRARAGGARISVDPSSAAPLRADPAFLDRARPVDLLLPNELEREALPRLDGVKEIVTTRGERGASWTDGVKQVDVPAIRLAEVTDTTGAGDAFAAGFLSAWPGDPERALAAGVQLAADAVQRAGSRPAYDGRRA